MLIEQDSIADSGINPFFLAIVQQSFAIGE